MKGEAERNAKEQRCEEGPADEGRTALERREQANGGRARHARPEIRRRTLPRVRLLSSAVLPGALPSHAPALRVAYAPVSATRCRCVNSLHLISYQLKRAFWTMPAPPSSTTAYGDVRETNEDLGGKADQR